MRKKSFIFVLFTILTCFCLVGCGTKKVVEKHRNSFEISLHENGSAGYNWSYNVNKDGIIDISESYDNSECDPEADGCEGKRIYKVTALKPGKTTLTLEYFHSVESENTPYKTAVYEIIVDNDLNIKETHYGTYFDGD